jgi:hypothetical protein
VGPFLIGVDMLGTEDVEEPFTDEFEYVQDYSSILLIA